ncbi:MAG: sigma-70 family RNA polymerase sigma factor [Elusimicrobia bacterium]|nr:sigma-70 family RNA polymerase sigma factor [Elusimicrobiota bacterium]
MENEDTQIITEIRGGKTSSFRFLVEKHQNKLYDLALRMTRSREDAEDIVQEAFVQAYSKLHQYNNTCSFANWIYTITLNIIRNKLRRKSLLSFCGFNQTLNDDDTQREFPDPWQNTEDNLDKKRTSGMPKK